MKKTTTALLGLSALMMAGLAQAEIIYETYTYSGVGDYDANSTLTAGENILFSFDLENLGGVGSVPDSFTLTQDAVGGVSGSDGWLSGSLEIDLYSIDSEFEITGIFATASGSTADDVLVIEGFKWNRSSASDPILNLVYDFTAADLSVFNELGLATVDIYATNSYSANDFAIARVSMAIDVPEPAMFSLLGLGLLGFGFARRARKA